MPEQHRPPPRPPAYDKLKRCACSITCNRNTARCTLCYTGYAPNPMTGRCDKWWAPAPPLPCLFAPRTRPCFSCLAGLSCLLRAMHKIPLSAWRQPGGVPAVKRHPSLLPRQLPLALPHTQQGRGVRGLQARQTPDLHRVQLRLQAVQGALRQGPYLRPLGLIRRRAESTEGGASSAPASSSQLLRWQHTHFPARSQNQVPLPDPFLFREELP